MIGAGAIAAVHIDAYLALSDECQITKICDIYVEKAQKLICEKGLHAEAVSSMEDVMQDPSIHAVSICLPPSLHSGIAVQALKYGKHVLVEKPMASSLEECDAMIKAAESSGCILSVVCQNRFKTPMQKVKQMIEERAAGAILHTAVNSLWWRGGSYYDLWWRGTWESECGGCMTSHAVHHIDLMQWMVGMPTRVTAVLSNVAHYNSECEDIGIAILEYPGMLAQITSSLITHGEEQEMIFQGETGRLSIPWKTAAEKALENGFPEHDEQKRAALEQRYQELPELSEEGHTAQVKNFLEAIQGKAPIQIDGHEGRKSIEIIMAIYKSASSGQSVLLPIQEEDPFYRKETMIVSMPRFFQKTKSVENFETDQITLGRNVGA